MRDPKPIFALVEDEFEAVNQLISQQLASQVPLVEKISEYIVNSGGKRLRPLLVLLSAGVLGKPGAAPVKLAAIIEFLHTATLLHDDVVDKSNLRRGRATANANWGNAPSVLVGDFLYSRAFQMMVELGSLPVMHILSDATNVIAEGEVMQLVNVKNPDVSEAAYRDVIRCKTAMLFQAASHSAATLLQAPAEQADALKAYGLHLGMAFQLIDDLLDYAGDDATLGKQVGDDLAEGKPTLPLIYAMAQGTAEEAALIRQAIRQGGIDQMDAIMAAVTRTGALDFTRRQAEAEVDKALALTHTLPQNPFNEALRQLAQLAVSRDH